MTDKKLKEALLKKLRCTPQALSQRVNIKKKRLPMSTEDAVYVIAHEHGFDLSRYLDSEKVGNIRSLIMNGKGAAAPELRPKQNIASTREIRIPTEFRPNDPLLSTSKLDEAREMAAIYPLLYVIENSLRELIKRVLSDRFGDNWWDTELKSGALKTVKNNVDSRLQKEETKEKWHQRRGDHPIDYVDLIDLKHFIRAHQTLFNKVLGVSLEWLMHFIEELYPSRCVVCHMNPLSATNLKDVRLRAEKWQKLIQKNIGRIPAI